MTVLAVRDVGRGAEPVPIRTLPFVIGRELICDLVLDDEAVSGRHAQLEVQPDGRVVLRDLGSAGGTFVGDTRLEGGAWFAVPGSFRVGGTTLTVETVADVAGIAVAPAQAVPLPVAPVAAATVATTGWAGAPAPVAWAPPRDESGPSPFRSARTRSRAAMLGIAGVTLVNVVEIVHYATFRGLVAGIQGGTLGVGDAEAFDSATQALSLAYLALFALAGIAFLAWLSRAVDNAPAIRAGTPPRSPRGAIGWWFVPFANLLVPFQIVADLHDRLGPRGADRARPLLLAWWLLYIAGSYVSLLALRAGSDTIEELQSGFDRGIVVDLLLVLSGVLAIAVVGKIQRREDVRAAAVAALPAS